MLDEKTTGALRQELGADAFVHLAEVFFINFGARLVSLENGVVREDRRALEFEAYSILGSAVNIGLSGLAHEAGVVMRHARAAEWDDIKAALSRLRHAALASLDAVEEDTGVHIACVGCRSFIWED